MLEPANVDNIVLPPKFYTTKLSRKSIVEPKTEIELLNNELLTLIDNNLGKSANALRRVFIRGTTENRLSRVNDVINKTIEILQGFCFDAAKENNSRLSRVPSSSIKCSSEPTIARTVLSTVSSRRLDFLKEEQNRRLHTSEVETKKEQFNEETIRHRIGFFTPIEQKIPLISEGHLNVHIDLTLKILQSTILWYGEYARYNNIEQKNSYREKILQLTEIRIALVEREAELAITEDQLALKEALSSTSGIKASDRIKEWSDETQRQQEEEQIKLRHKKENREKQKRIQEEKEKERKLIQTKLQFMNTEQEVRNYKILEEQEESKNLALEFINGRLICNHKDQEAKDREDIIKKEIDSFEDIRNFSCVSLEKAKEAEFSRKAKDKIVREILISEELLTRRQVEEVEDIERVCLNKQLDILLLLQKREVTLKEEINTLLEQEEIVRDVIIVSEDAAYNNIREDNQRYFTAAKDAFEQRQREKLEHERIERERRAMEEQERRRREEEQKRAADLEAQRQAESERQVNSTQNTKYGTAWRLTKR